VAPGVNYTTPNPVFTYSTYGVNQLITLIVTDDNGCSDTIDSTIYIKPAFDFTFDATTSCLGTPTQFHPVNLAPGDTLTDLRWTFGEPSSGASNTSMLYEPTHIYKTAQPFTVKLRAYNSDNCYDSVFRDVVVHPSPVLDISYNAGTHCDSLISFSQTVSGNGASIDSLYWQFGDGGDTTLLPPVSASLVHRYASYGLFQATATVYNHRGCLVTDTLDVNVACISASFINRDTLVCQQMKTVLLDHSAPATLIKSWRWLFGDGTDTTYVRRTSQIVHTWATPGNKTVTLIVTTMSNGDTIRDTTRLDLVVKPSPVSDFSAGSVCLGDSSRFINLTNSNNTEITAIQWKFADPGSGGKDTSTFSDPVYKYPLAGKYMAWLVTVNSLGCSDTMVKQTRVFKLPDARLTTPSACARNTLVFHDQSVKGDTVLSQYFWRFGNPELPLEMIEGKDVLYSYDHEGTYSIKLLVVDKNGCNDTASSVMMVKPSPVAAFSVTENYQGKPGQVKMNNKSSDSIVAYNWTFDPGKFSKEKNPVYPYAKDGKHNIQLIVKATNGCFDTTTMAYEFVFDNLFVPNAFSPTNLSDGLGCREFKPKGMNLRDYHVMVFDKWGHLIWESQLLTDEDDGRKPAQGWDGTFKGEPMPQDVYMWKINATFNNGKVWEGSEAGTGSSSTMGTVTLIR
jgi:PKD repeat protein